MDVFLLKIDTGSSLSYNVFIVTVENFQSPLFCFQASIFTYTLLLWR